MNRAFLLALFLVLAACDRGSDATTGTAVLQLTLTDEMSSRLAAADALDGNADHTIEKCVTCDLNMQGKPEHSVMVGEYRVELCSSGCRSEFERDPAKALMALSAPRK